MRNVPSLMALLAVSGTVLSKIRRWPSIKANTNNHNKLRSFRPRVLQGWSDINDEYPFVVKLLDYYGYRICTASLITKQWVLTAAHCIDPTIRYIKCGNMSISFKKTKCKSKVLRMIAHPSWTETVLKYDIALALVEEIGIKSLGRIHSADYKTFMGRAVRFAGFGATYHSYKYSSIGEDKARYKDAKRPLQVGEGVIFNAESEADVISIAPKCSNIRQSPYFGDSGGPLFVDKKIVGVLSGGGIDHTQSKRFVDAKHPEINYYTAVSPYLEWIRITINSKQ